MPGLALQLLGPFTVTVDNRPFGGLHIRPAVALCVYLACRPERHRREQLMALLWPNWPPAAAHKNLRQNLYTLRRALPEVALRDGRGLGPLVLADREALQLNPDAAVNLDVSRFNALLRENTPEAISAAVALYRGDFLADFYLPDSAPFEEWASALRADLHRQMLEALDQMAAYTLEHDAPGEAADYARRQLAMDNLRESAYRQLMRSLALMGRRSEAWAQYEMCAHLLRVELDMEPSTETRDLAGRIANGESDLSGPDTAAARPITPSFAGVPRHNLPLQLSSFIGREREIAEVQQFLGGSRLVTLTGPGGCGKTRLALEAATRLQVDFPDGVWWIELAPLADPGLVPQTVAFTLGLREDPNRPLEQLLADSLRPKKSLLLLDNCEHLIDACAELSDALLAACPRLHILASSREALGITGEVAYRVPSLVTADPDHLPPLDDLARVEAVRLFAERAAAVRLGFELAEGNGPAVAQIARRLNGIPLAIELAAARMKALSAAQIAQRLDDRFRLLTGGSRTALPRQQTLRAAIDWSYDLLSEPERRLFCRLAVFRGGWTLEAAEAVCAGPDLTGLRNLSGLDVLDLLGHLVDKSLVMVEERDGETRYSRLETIRQYGCEKLLESGEGDRVRRRHLDYFLDFAERGDHELNGPYSLEWTQRMERETDNLRAALEYAFGAEGVGDQAFRFILALAGFHGFWLNCSYWKEGIFWLEKALQNPGVRPGTALRAKLLFDYIIFVVNSPWEKQRPLLEESLAIFDSLGEPDCVDRAYVLMWLGFRLNFNSERETGTQYMQEALRIFETAGDKWGTGFALNLLSGMICELDGDMETAWAVNEQGLEAARACGERALMAVLLGNFGWYKVKKGDYSDGQNYLIESLAINKAFGHKGFACQDLRLLGDAARGLGDLDKAEALYRESLAMVQDIGWQSYGINVRLYLGLTVLHQGDVQQALKLFTEALEVAYEARKPEYPRIATFFFLDCVAAALTVRERADDAARLFGAFDAQFDVLLADGFSQSLFYDAIDRREHEHYLSLCRAQLDAADFDRCWQEGRALPLEEAVELARACAESLTEKVTPVMG